jgi:hypothetical protein
MKEKKYKFGVEMTPKNWDENDWFTCDNEPKTLKEILDLLTSSFQLNEVETEVNDTRIFFEGENDSFEIENGSLDFSGCTKEQVACLFGELPFPCFFEDNLREISNSLEFPLGLYEKSKLWTLVNEELNHITPLYVVHITDSKISVMCENGHNMSIINQVNESSLQDDYDLICLEFMGKNIWITFDESIQDEIIGSLENYPVLNDEKLNSCLNENCPLLAEIGSFFCGYYGDDCEKDIEP